MNGVIGYHRQFPLRARWQRELQVPEVAVLTNSVGVWLFPAATGMFCPQKDTTLLELTGASATAENLSCYLSANHAHVIEVMHERCQRNHEKTRGAWRLYSLDSSELVLANDSFKFFDTLSHKARPVVVVVHRNGISVHERVLRGQDICFEQESALFLPHQAITPETLRRHVSALDAAEIMAVYLSNRDQLLQSVGRRLTG